MRTHTLYTVVSYFACVAMLATAMPLVCAEEKAAPQTGADAAAHFAQASAQRKLGLDALDQAAAKPAEASQLRKLSAERFAEAVVKFALAAGDFSTTGATPNREWILRCRCEQCDALLRLEKNTEAAELARKTLDDKECAASPLRALALYQSGCANFALNNALTAGRALSQLSPFDQEFGLHARYVLSRIHHSAGEFPEAGAGYKALLSDYEQRKKIAVEALKNPGALKPDERARYDALLKPTPDFIARAAFYNALLSAEAGEFAEALTGFAAFVQQFPAHALIDEAKLRHGYCLVQVKNFAEAIKVFQPLQKHPRLGDRAMWWQARAHAGGADPANAVVFEPAVKSAVELLAKAAEKAGALSATDSEAKDRRGDILLELGDTQLLARLHKEAAATYEKVFAEYSGSDRAEKALQRQAAALHLAGQYQESDALCDKFEQAYSTSTLLPAVWFRSAENACLSARFDEAIGRYQRLIAKFPEFANVNPARYGLGTAQFRRGQFADAFSTLSTILDADRSGDLAHVNDLLADCLVRQFPVETSDALQSAQLIDRAEQAARLLEKYAGSQGKTPQAAAALLKLGHCYQRMGVLVIDPAERQKLLTQARQVYEKILNEYGSSPSMPNAVLERARVIALQGDINGALNEYKRFDGDALKRSPVAPLALIREASLLRTQNRHNDALNLMAECRKRYEEALSKDPLRGEWAPLLKYEYALALKDMRRLSEARAIFEALARQFEKQPEGASARWRAAQCQREDLLAELSVARGAQKKAAAKSAELASANKKLEQLLADLRGLAEALKSEVAKREPAAPIGAAQLWLLYESAWCYRALADVEIESVRQNKSSLSLQKILANLKQAAPNQAVPALAPPDVPLGEIPQQPGEKAAQEQYAAILSLAPASAVASRARLELAEMQAQRGQNDAALELLVTGLEEDPSPELAERLHLRLAACLLAKDERKLALVQTQAVMQNPASSLLSEAVLITGECHIQNKDWPNAIAQLAVFRDKDPFRNMNVVTERGLLRLGLALAQALRWDESRQALEMLVQRFPQSVYLHEARFGIGTAWQNAGQFDNAYNTYAEITRRSAAEVAAQAQLRMGQCRMAQKRFPDALKDLLAAVSTYDYPEVSAEALCEAGQVQMELKQPAEAAKLWQGLIKDYAASKWAEAAKKRLAGMK